MSLLGDKHVSPGGLGVAPSERKSEKKFWRMGTRPHHQNHVRKAASTFETWGSRWISFSFYHYGDGRHKLLSLLRLFQSWTGGTVDDMQSK